MGSGGFVVSSNGWGLKYLPGSINMKILMVASEVEPYSKTGGLADVLGALPKALAELGHEVAVVSPLYRDTPVKNADVVFDSLSVRVGKEMHFPRVVTLLDDAVRHYFVAYDPFFDRDALYGDADGDYPDNPRRFFLFARAAMEIAKLAFRPDLIHCHEWQAAMVPVLVRSVYSEDAALRETPILFTIHNLGYQGVFEAPILGELGLPDELLSVDGLEYYGKISFLKGALIYSDALSTVSKKYASEIQTEEYGCGLEGVVRSRSEDLYGVLNGADYTQWNPERDPLIAARYTTEDLRGKETCKHDLLESYGLAVEDNRPLVGLVARLAWQKGGDLLIEAVDELMADDCAIVILAVGDAATAQALHEAARKYPDRFGFCEGFDEHLAHKIEAGADIFLMPSRYEPCGLNQMYSLRYGTVPVVRSTGGLDDTVTHYENGVADGTGFKFSEYSAAAMVDALRQAFAVYKDRDRWRTLMRNGMQCDYSWPASAREYQEIYDNMLEKRG